jgi:hypothetical protein
MSDDKQLSSVLSAGLIAIGLIGSSVMLGRAEVQAFRIKHAEQRVVVTGSATKGSSRTCRGRGREVASAGE